MTDAPAGLVLPSYDDVLAAAARLDGVAHRTPVLTSRTADARTGARLFFKAEPLQRMGAFKFRGGYNAIAALSPEQRRAGVLTFSSGNHAQAIAYAGALLHAPTVIIMPEDAPPAKIAATRDYGGEVLLYDRYKQDRTTLGAQIAAERGLTVIPPFDHPDVIAGQGTATKELIEEIGPLDIVLAPCGGGGLLGGTALAAKALSPGCAVYGVEPEAGDDARQSLRAGRIIAIPVPRTIADGTQTTAIGRYTFALMQRDVADILTVPDEALRETMRFFAERMKLVVEPSGALAAAAVFTGALPVAGKRVGIILSGGNVDLAAYGRILAEPAGAA